MTTQGILTNAEAAKMSTANVTFVFKETAKHAYREIKGVAGTVVRSLTDIKDAGLRKFLAMIQTILKIAAEALTLAKSCLSVVVETLSVIELPVNIYTLFTDWAKHTKAKVCTIVSGIFCGIIGAGMLLDTYRVTNLSDAIGNIPTIGPALQSIPSSGFFFMNIFAGLATFFNIVNDVNTIRGANRDKGTLSRKENIECQEVLEMIGSITGVMKDYLHRCQYYGGENAVAFADRCVESHIPEYELKVARLTALETMRDFRNTDVGALDISMEVERRVNTALNRRVLDEHIWRMREDGSGQYKDVEHAADAGDEAFRARLKDAIDITNDQITAYATVHTKLIEHQYGDLNPLDKNIHKQMVIAAIQQKEFAKCRTEASDLREIIAKQNASLEGLSNTVEETARARAMSQPAVELDMMSLQEKIASNNQKLQAFELRAEQASGKVQAAEEEIARLEATKLAQDTHTPYVDSPNVLEISWLTHTVAQRQLQDVGNAFQRVEAAKAARSAVQGDSTDEQAELDVADKDLKLRDTALTNITDKYTFMAHNYKMDARKPVVGVIANIFKLIMHALLLAGILSGVIALSFTSPWLAVVFVVVGVTAYAKIYVDNSKHKDEDIKPLRKQEAMLAQFGTIVEANG